MASTLSGPIPQHPMYCSNGLNDSHTKSQPRVKPEAANYAAHGQKGTVANLFEVTGTSYGSASTSPFRQKKQPRDHVSENVRRMRQIQKKCRQKQREEENSAPIPVKALWKSEKYEIVPSKLADFLHQTPHSPKPQATHYLRAHSRTGIPPRPQTSHTPRTPSPVAPRGKPPVERLEGVRSKSASCSDLSAVGRQVDFVKINGLAASRQSVKRPPSALLIEQSVQRKAERYDEYKRNVKGTVPKYLEKRKQEWKIEEEERIKNTPDPDMPHGHRLMPSEERLDTLKLLQQSHRELSGKLAALPIRSDTLRIRRSKEELEGKLAEIEEAVKIFARPKVFVKID